MRAPDDRDRTPSRTHLRRLPAHNYPEGTRSDRTSASTAQGRPPTWLAVFVFRIPATSPPTNRRPPTNPAGAARASQDHESGSPRVFAETRPEYASPSRVRAVPTDTSSGARAADLARPEAARFQGGPHERRLRCGGGSKSGWDQDHKWLLLTPRFGEEAGSLPGRIVLP